MVNLSFWQTRTRKPETWLQTTLVEIEKPKWLWKTPETVQPGSRGGLFGEVVEWPIGSIPQRLGIRSLGKVFGDVWGPTANVMQTRRPILTLWQIQFTVSKLLHNCYITMENHHVQWFPLFLWPFSIAFCLFTRPGIWSYLYHLAMA
jgi:hypothetical protein